jgi:hypothetical protein
MRPRCPHRGLAALVVLVVAACDRGRAPGAGADAGRGGDLSVRVPGALMIARGLDSVSVSIDPASLASTTVHVAPGMVIGVETDCAVFPLGQPRPSASRHGLAASADFDVGTSTWNATPDGIPAQGTKYVAEMRIVLFQTDVPLARPWNPHAGHFEALWSQTLRQAEE